MAETDMKGEERRNKILETLDASRPTSASTLAGMFGVSRQVIVQDVALLRSAGFGIVSTPRGYVYAAARQGCSRTFKVRHADDQTEEELTMIVDAGGTVENVIVHHRVYGTIEAQLGVGSRVQVAEYMRSISEGRSSLLKNVTDGYHYHTVTAPDEGTLDEIESLLRRRGFLVER